MYKQERLQQPVEFAPEAGARAVGQAVKKVAGEVRRVLAAVFEPFGGLQQIESLDPKARANMTARDKAIIDAYLHGPQL